MLPVESWSEALFPERQRVLVPSSAQLCSIVLPALGFTCRTARSLLRHGGRSPRQPGAGTLNALTDPKSQGRRQSGLQFQKQEGGLDLITACRLFRSLNGKKGGKEREMIRLTLITGSASQH